MSVESCWAALEHGEVNFQKKRPAWENIYYAQHVGSINDWNGTNGDDGSDEFATLSRVGAFADFTSQKIFEESGKGILASL